MNLSVVLLVLAATFLAWSLWRMRPAVQPVALRAELAAGTAVLVDVREPPEWAGGTVPQAARLSLSDLRGPRREWTAFLEANRGKRIFLYCQSGTRSGLAAALLRREGFDARNAGTYSALNRA